LDLRYFDFPYGGKRRYSRRFVEAFGEPRPPGGPVTQRDRDLAASLQACLEETVLHLCRHLARRTGASKLCLAGGVALNSQMNARILASGIFEELFILPAAGDPGTALGAALLAAYHVAGVRRSFPLVTPFLGPAYEKARCRAALSQAGLPFREVADAPAEAARLLAAGKIVGWFQERLEFGPRALGNRSILADPRDPAMKARLNARIKGREPFRPFAPAILAERVSEFFVRPTLSPYMLLVETIRPEKRGLIPAVVHHDGTGRLQTVSRRDNPPFYALISAFANRTGIPLLLNTSFNRKGEPIVCTPEDAIATFRTAGLDALFLGDLCVEREE
ncbi:MAG: carbamoyl transferase, partial [Deltaproteobacteria bacterium]